MIGQARRIDVAKEARRIALIQEPLKRIAEIRKLPPLYRVAVEHQLSREMKMSQRHDSGSR